MRLLILAIILTTSTAHAQIGFSRQYGRTFHNYSSTGAWQGFSRQSLIGNRIYHYNRFGQPTGFSRTTPSRLYHFGPSGYSGFSRISGNRLYHADRFGRYSGFGWVR